MPLLQSQHNKKSSLSSVNFPARSVGRRHCPPVSVVIKSDLPEASPLQ